MDDEIIELLKSDNAIGLSKIYIKKNWQKSVNLGKIYRVIHNLDNPSILNFMSFLYTIDFIGNKNIEQAIEYLKTSADLGDSNAQAIYGIILSNEYKFKTALHYIKHSVEQKNPLGYNNIVVLYLKVLRPIEAKKIDRQEQISARDILTYEEALEYLMKSDMMGHTKALFNIGELYKTYNHGQNCKMLIHQSKKVNILSEEKDVLKREIELLKCRNRELELENAEFKYQPGGVGYEEAKEDFL